jgi:PAS domain S-box-containing protein
LIVGLILFAAAVTAVLGVLRLADAERDRTLQVWQTRLGIVVDSRRAAIEGWLARQFDALSGLGGNTAVQLYLTEMARPDTAASPDRAEFDRARVGYLRNLLMVVAHRGGFVQRVDGPAVNANVRRVAVAGIALVGLDGRVFGATDAMPPIEGRLADFLRDARRGEPALRDMYRDAAGAPAMAFATPIHALQGDGTPASQIGWVVGIKQVGPELFPLLHQPGTVWRSAEALLVRRDGNAITYLSPTGADNKALERSLAANTEKLAAGFALEAPGGFEQRRDYRGEEVLVAPRRLERAPWTLLYKIDRSEALGADDVRIRRLIMLLLAALAAIAAGLFAVWRHASSRRAEQLAAENAAIARRYETQSRFLKLVTDSQPGAMFIVDSDNRYRFANRAVSLRAGIDETDMIGKSMASVIGPAEASRYEQVNLEVMTSGDQRQQIHRSGANGDLRIMQADHIPISTELELGAGVMVVEEDITAAVAERERSERTLEHLVTTLVGLIDQRDPHATDHSERVARVAGAIAGEIGLDDQLVGTAKNAGRLMNLGKLLVPTELLTRTGTLAEEEVSQIRDGLLQGANLLADIEFDGPVVETLRQMSERWDGGGPMARAGDDILITAQIVAVANAFVALISSRAWRPGIEPVDAVDRLLTDSDGAYARRVISALANLVDNRGLAAPTVRA